MRTFFLKNISLKERTTCERFDLGGGDRTTEQSRATFGREIESKGAFATSQGSISDVNKNASSRIRSARLDSSLLCPGLVIFDILELPDF